MNNLDNEEKLFIFFNDAEIDKIFHSIKQYKEKMDEIFMKIFFYSYYNENYNSELMKRWTVFTKKINDWNKDFYCQLFDGVFPFYDLKKMKELIKELYNIYQETFNSIYKI